VLSIAILNHESAELTRRCARSILDAPPSEQHELLVIDNGSSDETLAALRGIVGARVVATGVNGGFAAGVNHCLAASDPTADVVVVLNADTEVMPGALDALAAAAREPGVGMAAPVLLEGDGGVQRSAHRRFPTLWTTWMALCVPVAQVQTWLERRLRHPTALTRAEHEAGARPLHVMGAAMAFRRTAWDEVGRFDERFFMYLEETEWQRRLHAGGWAVSLVAAARVRHLHRGGDDAVVVPPLRYLDSARVYFRAQGHADCTIRLALASALLLSYLALCAATPLVRRMPRQRRMVAASIPLARRGFVHALRGRTLPRPDDAP
jgi:N-acetylglucosaminyl-diphospho-decaprenol L-rhamnosyltransferase